MQVHNKAVVLTIISYTSSRDPPGHLGNEPGLRQNLTVDVVKPKGCGYGLL